MNEQRISFKTAKLAKEKGFNEITGGQCWVKTLSGKIIHNSERHPIDDDRVDSKFYLAQPTQSLLQKWLREKHEINLYVFFRKIKWGYCIKNNIHTGFFKSYEEALEKGLQEALKLIK